MRASTKEVREGIDLKQNLLTVAKARVEHLKAEFGSISAAKSEASNRALGYRFPCSHRPTITLQLAIWQAVWYMLDAEEKNESFDLYEREIDSRHYEFKKGVTG